MCLNSCIRVKTMLDDFTIRCIFEGSTICLAQSHNKSGWWGGGSSSEVKVITLV